MSGKVFAESANIYEDQAKVLFDYFREVAEKIVAQEEELEKKIAVAKEEVVQFSAAQTDKATREKLGWGIAAGGAALLVLSFVLKDYAAPLMLAGIAGLAGGAIFGFLSRKQAAEFAARAIASSGQIAGFEQAHQQIRRDFRVHKLGIAYVPVAGQVPFEGRSFLIDYTGSEEKKEFRLSTVRKKDLFLTSIKDLDQIIRSVPAVEQATAVEEVETDQYSRSIQKIPYYDYFGGLDRKLRTLTHCLSDLETNAVQIPVIFPNSPYAKFLAEFATTEPENGAVLKVFNAEQYSGALEKFQSLSQMKKSLERHSRQFEQVLRRLMVNIAQTVQAVTELKLKSTSALIERSNRLFFTVLKASYNHYSPRLESEEIDRISHESFDYQESVDNYRPFHLRPSSRVLYDPVSENWVAEDGSRTSYPFGMQQLQEEVLAPIVESLMQETRLERLKIYHNIQDQKNDYLNKWHQDTEDFYGRNRAESADLINLMRSSLTEFIANYNTLQALESTDAQMAKTGDEASSVVEAKDSGAESLASYDSQCKQYQAVQDDFLNYMDRLKEEIDRRAEKFRFIEYYDASLCDDQARAMSQAGQRMQTMDERRKPLLAVNPLYAEDSELAPAPAIEQLAQTHCALDLNLIANQAILQLSNAGGER